MNKPKHLSDKFTRQTLCYLSQLRDELRLTNWDLILMKDTPDDDDSWAQITPVENHLTACVCLSQDLEKNGTTRQLTTVLTHELVHLLHRDVGDLFNDISYKNSSISTDEAIAWNVEFSRYTERMVSHMAKLLADGGAVTKWPGTYTEVSIGISVQGDHI